MRGETGLEPPMTGSGRQRKSGLFFSTPPNVAALFAAWFPAADARDMERIRSCPNQAAPIFAGSGSAAIALTM